MHDSGDPFTASRYPHSLTGTTPDARRSLAVAPLIADKRCYGSLPGKSRRGNGEHMGLKAGQNLRNRQGCALRKPLSNGGLWASVRQELGLVSGFGLRLSSFGAYAAVAGRRKRSSLGTSM